MSDSSEEFMETARLLSSTNHGFVPSVGNRRGAIVMAYYAVFHRLAEICAEELAGNRADNVKSSRAWNEYYRCLDHTTIRRACQVAKTKRLFSSTTDIFCQWFPNLQDARELCNYEALVEPTLEESLGILFTAEECINCLNGIEESERKDFVAWMILALRGGVKKVRDEFFKKDANFFADFGKKYEDT